MTRVLNRYWNGLSPALRRYYRASLWPGVAFIAAAGIHEWMAGQAETATPLRLAAAVLPVLAMGWMFACYLRFLRDCDELERRIELGALAWSSGIAMLAALGGLLLLDAALVQWSARHVAAGLLLLVVGGYALVRAGLHRHYA